MPQFLVQNGQCQKCGICALVCPSKLIHAESKKLPVMTANTQSQCRGCGQCVAFCPSGASSLMPHEPEEDGNWGKSEGFAVAKLPSGEAVATLMQSRRSIRVYKKSPVPKYILEQLMQTVRFAPTATNSQRIRWIMFYSRKSLLFLGDLLAEAMLEHYRTSPDDPMASKAPGMAKDWADGKDPFFRGAPHLLGAIVPKREYWRWGAEEGAIALTYAELLAHGLGLGACWAGYLTIYANAYAPLRNALGLEPDEHLAGGQMLGHPKHKAKCLPYRPFSKVDWR